MKWKTSENKRGKQIRRSFFHIDIPEEMCPRETVRLVFVTDVHNCRGGLTPEEIARAVEECRPDVIVSGGDLITARHGEFHGEQSACLLERLCDLAPVYLGEGNHESRLREHPELYPGIYEGLREKAARLGALWLCNEQRRLDWKGLPVSLDSFNPSLDYYDRFHPKTPGCKTVRELIGDREPGAFHVMLSHHPDFFGDCAEWGADLTLSGHFHGGIIRVPFLGGLCGGSLRPFPKYDRGLFERGGKRLVVSSGLGLHTIPLRFNNPFELVVLELAGG
ncbi:MAG: metallophosphoesterase [Lachnospiraceae bacterium]|nr:metallophosphoesterase [Lachnospiraceae bacterium]